jgi:hypothetical protein
VQFLKFTFLYVTIFSFVLSVARPGLAQEDYESEWPCIQRLVDSIPLATVWQGPAIKEFTATWWEDKTLLPLVNELLDETLTEEESADIINGYVETLGKDKDKKLLALFSGLFLRSSELRARQIRGIKEFYRRQIERAERIGLMAKELRNMEQEGVGEESPEYMGLSETLIWNTRIYDERNKLIDYVCEAPVFLEQRLGIQARIILENIQ